MAAEGIQAVGQAGVLGGSINPLSLYINTIGAREKARAKALDDYRAARDNYYSDLRKWQPDKVWDDFRDIISTKVQKTVREPAMFMLERARNEYELRNVDAEVARRHDEVNMDVSKFNGLKDLYDQKEKQILANPLFKKGFNGPISQLNDIKDEWHSAFADGQSPNTDLSRIDMNPNNYDEASVIDSFVKTIPEQAKDVFGKTFGPNGEYLNTTQLQSKFDYETVIDPKTGLVDWKYDKDGRRILRMNDNLYTLARTSPEVRLLMEAGGGQTEDGQKEWLAARLPGYDKTKRDVRVSTGFRTAEADRRYSAFGRSFKVPIVDLESRDRELDKIVTTHAPDLAADIGRITAGVKLEYTGLSVPDALGNRTPTELTVTYPGKTENIDIGTRTISKAPETVKLSLATEEGRRAAKIALSRILDQFDTKRSLGEEYARYIQAAMEKGTGQTLEEGALDDLGL